MDFSICKNRTDLEMEIRKAIAKVPLEQMKHAIDSFYKRIRELEEKKGDLLSKHT